MHDDVQIYLFAPRKRHGFFSSGWEWAVKIERIIPNDDNPGSSYALLETLFDAVIDVPADTPNKAFVIRGVITDELTV